MNTSCIILLLLCLLHTSSLSPHHRQQPRHGRPRHHGDRQHIVGGEEVNPPHSIPFQVSLQLTDWGDWHFCGGSLLTDKVVITAAHCCYEQDLAMVKVMAGKHDLYAEEDTEQAAGIARADIHPQYDPWTVKNDICLLTLDTAFKITDAVDVVRPAFTGETFSGSGRVSGWGTLEDGGVSPDMLMSVVVELQEDSVCREVYGEEAVVDSMLCAGGQDKDACQGDSGGPLVCSTTPGGGYDVLCGLVSWGLGCGRVGYPGVYTEVAAFKNWIDGVLLR